MTKHSVAFLAAAAALGLAPPASAQEQGQPQPCAKRTLVVERLAEKYGETLQSIGMHSNNGLLEVYASEATGTWTILVTNPDGTSCMLAAGEMWETHVDHAKPGKDA